MRIPDNLDLFEAYEREQQAAMELLPVCEYCSQPIQDEHLWDIEGTLYHEKCAELQFRKSVDDYVS